MLAARWIFGVRSRAACCAVRGVRCSLRPTDAGNHVSSVARNQLQAMQMTFSSSAVILLSGSCSRSAACRNGAGHRQPAASDALRRAGARHHAQGQRCRRTVAAHLPIALHGRGDGGRVTLLPPHAGTECFHTNNRLTAMLSPMCWPWTMPSDPAAGVRLLGRKKELG